MCAYVSAHVKDVAKVTSPKNSLTTAKHQTNDYKYAQIKCNHLWNAKCDKNINYNNSIANKNKDQFFSKIKFLISIF